MKYELKTSPDGRNSVVRDNEDGTCSEIPANEANSDYQAYLNKDKAQTLMVIDGDQLQRLPGIKRSGSYKNKVLPCKGYGS